MHFGESDRPHCCKGCVHVFVWIVGFLLEKLKRCLCPSTKCDMVLLDLKTVRSIPGKSENQQRASEDTAIPKQMPAQQQKFCKETTICKQPELHSWH